MSSLLKLIRHPVTVQMAQVGLIAGTGDILAQTVVEGKKLHDVDLLRTAKFSSIGALFIGPSLHVWYSTLERIVAKNQPLLRRTLKKMAVDQICFAPIFGAAVTIVISAANGSTTEEIKKRMQNEYISLLKTNYLLWPAAQLINFSVVPLQYQVIFAQFVALFWNMYLSMILMHNRDAVPVAVAVKDAST